MSYAGLNDIKLTLTTAEGRTGWRWLSRPDDMTWDDEGDDETVSAVFEFIGSDGDEQQSWNIDGDEWRELEDAGELDRVLYWVRRGIDLEDAIEAAIEGSDPGNVDGELHGDIDKLVQALRKTTAALAAWVEIADKEDRRDTDDEALSEANSLLESYAGRE